jgi:NAD(P)-dependent dehydrogenase (short-subunit alcohol dehydrogenase family)
MPRLEGKRALITGGTSGIGLETARQFLAEGARVAITGFNPATLERARKEVGGDVRIIDSDAGSPAAQKALARDVQQSFGSLDILVLNAGINTSIYGASKAALLSLAKTLSGELIGRGIRVNAVSPGPIVTPLYDKLGLSPDDRKATSESLIGRIPVHRFGEPAEVASAIMFFASDESQFTIGSELVIDGGMHNL